MRRELPRIARGRGPWGGMGVIERDRDPHLRSVDGRCLGTQCPSAVRPGPGKVSRATASATGRLACPRAATSRVKQVRRQGDLSGPSCSSSPMPRRPDGPGQPDSPAGEANHGRGDRHVPLGSPAHRRRAVAGTAVEHAHVVATRTRRPWTFQRPSRGAREIDLTGPKGRCESAARRRWGTRARRRRSPVPCSRGRSGNRPPGRGP